MLLFIGVPLLEIAVILQVGSAIGGWPTAGILVLDSVIGAWLLKVEGRRAWLEFRQALNEGRWPGDEVAQGALIIVGGTLLVTPGFVTDVVGFAFLIAPTRRLVARGVRSRVGGRVGGAPGAPGAAGDPRDAPGARGAVSDPRGSRSGRSATNGPSRSSGASSDRGPGRSRPRGSPPPGHGRADDLDLDIEVVEIRREQGPPPRTDEPHDGSEVGADDPEPHEDDDAR